MSRQIPIGSANPPDVLERRIAILERQVAALTEAVRTLAAGLEGTPFDEPDTPSPAQAARLARELLIEARSRGG